MAVLDRFGWGQKVRLYVFLGVVVLHIGLGLATVGGKSFARRHTLDPGCVVKLYLFLKEVMLRVRLKAIEHRAP